MAIFREAPRCYFCGGIIAKAIYTDQSSIPITMQLVGDTFKRWEYFEHECDEENPIILKIKSKNNN